MRDAGVLAGVALAVGGWWYVRNAILYGDPLGLSVHLNTPWARPAPIPLTEVLSALPLVYRSFWGAFGWGNVEMSPIIYYALASASRSSRSMVRLPPAAASWPPVPNAECPQPAIRNPVCVSVVQRIFVSFLRWNQQVAAPHGRLLFPMLGAFAVLLVAGLARLPHPRIVLGIIVAGFLLLSLAVPFVYIRPAYAHPELFPPDQLAVRHSSFVIRPLLYGDEARLIGFGLDRPFCLARRRAQRDVVLGSGSPDDKQLHPLRPSAGARKPRRRREEHLARPGSLSHLTLACGPRVL